VMEEKGQPEEIDALNGSPKSPQLEAADSRSGEGETSQQFAAPKHNIPRLQADLKSCVEASNGISIDSDNVHYDSSKPARVNASAYAQSNDIHLVSSQDKRLPREAWHVVQQAQNTAGPTSHMTAAVHVSDDKALEHEADEMGAKAVNQIEVASSQGLASDIAECSAPSTV
jgi:hypothetical protein